MSKKDLINKKNVAIVVLIVVALVLGIAIKSKDGGSSNSSGTSPAGFASTGEPRDLTNLSDDEKSVLEVPYSGTDEEKQAHFDLAASLARENDALDISGCLGSPLVMVVPLGSNLKVTNNDSIDHEIIFDQDTSFNIPAEGSKTLKGVFSKGVGLYGYGCDKQPGVSGLFLITQ